MHEHVGSNPDTIYWMESNQYYLLHWVKRNKNSQMKHTQKY